MNSLSFWGSEPVVYRCPKKGEIVAITGQKSKVLKILENSSSINFPGENFDDSKNLTDGPVRRTNNDGSELTSVFDDKKLAMNIQGLLDELGDNTAVLAEIINILRDLVRDDKVKCECKSRDIDILIDKSAVLLRCEKCGNEKIVPVRYTELDKLKKLKEIKLTKPN
jgi:predicted RNA-binding Zn-ribbon protein involved in translation (DUF1610 family)